MHQEWPRGAQGFKLRAAGAGGLGFVGCSPQDIFRSRPPDIREIIRCLWPIATCRAGRRAKHGGACVSDISKLLFGVVFDVRVRVVSDVSRDRGWPFERGRSIKGGPTITSPVRVYIVGWPSELQEQEGRFSPAACKISACYLYVAGCVGLARYYCLCVLCRAVRCFCRRQSVASVVIVSCTLYVVGCHCLSICLCDVCGARSLVRFH